MVFKIQRISLLVFMLLLFNTFTAGAEVIYQLFNVSSAENTVTLNTLLKNHIPKPFNAAVLSDSIHIKGKKKQTVMPVLLKELQKNGWVEISAERKGEIQYFIKTIKGENIKISLVPAERGGPEEANTSTFIYFRIISKAQENNKNINKN